MYKKQVSVVFDKFDKTQLSIISDAIEGEENKVQALKSYLEGYSNVSQEGEEYEDLEKIILQILSALKNLEDEELNHFLSTFSFKEYV